MDDPDQIRRDTLAAIAGAQSREALEQVRVAALGRKGTVTNAMKALGALDPEARKRAGAALNRLKDEVAAAIADADSRLGEIELAARLALERIDVTLPVATEREGRIHPISQTIDELTAIFGEMGFSVAEGPHIEEDFYNFTALNIPPEHPARQEHDTFYLPPRPAHRSNRNATVAVTGDDGSRLVLRT
ncbi:MAG: phenylalanine--tRNA ligase subunit alpha, partial [Alphaproteobacteria bacterium]|nr:phenylalanine--tRNA ligase subunit alpha [Alphaproteobacteria bacterium]